MTRRRAAAAAAALAVGLAGCGGESELEVVTETVVETETQTEVVTETVGTEPGGKEELAERCENPEGGYAVRYPGGWHTNDGSVTAPCSFFHPEAFELPEASEPPPLAVSIGREPVAFADATGGNPGIRIVSSEEVEVAGRPAVRRETDSTGEALFPAGVRALEYLVDLEGETLVAVTRSRGELDFERNRDVLDRIVATLELR